MNREKAIEIYNELKVKCHGLILAGSVLKEKEGNIRDLDLIWVGKIFPMHLLPVGEIGKDSASIKGKGANILRFEYKGQVVDIHRTDEDNLPAMISRLSGHHINVKQK